MTAAVDFKNVTAFTGTGQGNKSSCCTGTGCVACWVPVCRRKRARGSSNRTSARYLIPDGVKRHRRHHLPPYDSHRSWTRAHRSWRLQQLVLNVKASSCTLDTIVYGIYRHKSRLFPSTVPRSGNDPTSRSLPRPDCRAGISQRYTIQMKLLPTFTAWL